MKYELWKVLNDNKSNALAKYLLYRDVDSKFTQSNLKSTDFKANLYAYLRQETPEAYVKRDLDFRSSPYVNKDLRIEYIKISGFRGIPNLHENKKTKMDAFGISLGKRHIKSKSNHLSFELNTDSCCSLILLGCNGTGKTSIYSAIELLCTGSMAIEKKHRIKDENLSNFRHYLKETQPPFHIELKIKDPNSEKLKLNGNDNPSSLFAEFYRGIDLSPFFCSESDLAIFECSGKSITDYVYDVCGLGEIQAVKELCEDLINYEENADKDDGDTRSDNIKGQVAQFAIDLIQILEKEHEKIRESVLVQAQRILEELLSDFVDNKVNLSYVQTNGQKYFNGQIRIRTNNTEIEPREYFNNFRFKLYLISLRIGIAFYIMKSRNIMFPLIFDDIFDSSDFSNRVQTKHFMQKIMEIYSSEKISESLLQVIFFTQDEIIAESVYNGICQTKIKENHNIKEIEEDGIVILGRLFPMDSWDIKDEAYLYKEDVLVDSIINLFDQIKQHKY